MVEEEINIEGIVVMEPGIYNDSRGFFLETFNNDRNSKFISIVNLDDKDQISIVKKK